MRSLSLALLLFGVAVAGCTCGQPEPEPQPESAGRLAVVVDGTTATISVSGLQRSLRSFQADVEVTGGQASAIAAVGAHDLVEAGLGDGAKAAFTAVVADTRRLPINNGAVLRLTIDNGARVSLRNGIAVDDTGSRRTLDVEAP